MTLGITADGKRPVTYTVTSSEKILQTTTSTPTKG